MENSKMYVTRYRDPLGGDTVQVRGQGDFLEKLDQAILGCYLKRDSEGKAEALYIHITREVDVEEFWEVYLKLGGS